MKNDPWIRANQEVDAVLFSLKGSGLKYIELSDGVNKAEADVLNEWVAAFIDIHGYKPDVLALRAMTERLDPTGARIYGTNAKSGMFTGRSPNPLKPDQIELEPETERPDPVQLLRQAQSLLNAALNELSKANVSNPAISRADVEALYQELLGRSADDEGAKYWMSNAISVGQLRAALMESQEYLDRQAKPEAEDDEQTARTATGLFADDYQPPHDTSDAGLARINKARAQAGLPPVERATGR